MIDNIVLSEGLESKERPDGTVFITRKNIIHKEMTKEELFNKCFTKFAMENNSGPKLTSALYSLNNSENSIIRASFANSYKHYSKSEIYEIYFSDLSLKEFNNLYWETFIKFHDIIFEI